MRRLNIRLLLILLVGIAVGGAAIQGLHAFQVSRQSGAFLREAERAEQSGKPQEAIDFLRKYVLLRTRDAETTARLGKLLFDQRRYKEAQRVFGQVLQQDPTNDAARRQLVDVSMRLGRYQDAQYHLDEFLLKSHPADGDLWFRLGTCQQSLGDYLPAASSFAIALEKNATLIGPYERLAQLLAERPQILADRNLPGILMERLSNDPSAATTLVDLKKLIARLSTDPSHPSAALDLLDLMVTQNSKNGEAYAVRGRFVRSHLSDPLVRAALLRSGARTDAQQVQEMLHKAFDDAKQALDLAPSDSQVLLFAAQAALAIGSTKQAREFAERASKQEPTNAESYLVLASLELREKHRKEAADLLARGVKATGGSPVLMWTLADLRIETNDVAEAGKLIDRLRTLEWARPIAQYLSARVLTAESNWAQACRQLEPVVGDLERWPQLHKEAQLWRARCYSRLGRDDLAVGAYRAALEIDPVWTPARVGLAEALRAQGRIDEAVVELRRLQQLPDAPPETSMNLLRLAAQQNLSRPPNEREWRAIDIELDKMLKGQPTAGVILLAAEVRVAEGRIDDARQMLSSAMTAHPKEPAIWSALISLASQNKAWGESERLLQDMEGRFRDDVSFRLTKAEYLVRRFGVSRKSDLRALASPPPAYSASDRLTLAMGMARAAVAIQDYEQAERLWGDAADRDPTNLQIQLLLFDLALQMGRPEAMQKALQKVQAIERNGPISFYGEALRSVMLAKQKKDNALFDQALAQLLEARARRPNWSKTALLAAEINDFRGRHDEALENYLEAIELGERKPNAIARALNLMFDRKDYSRAESLIRKLRDEKTPFSTEIARFASEASLQAGELDRALELARTVADESHNIRDRIWLATVLQLSDKPQDAELELKKATTAAPADASAWVALIQLYATTGQKDLAQKALVEAKKKINQKQAPVALAYAEQLLGQLPEAGALYDAAVKSTPGDFEVRKRAIEFKLKVGREEEAESWLREFLASGQASNNLQNRAWARRTLALSLAASSTNPKHLEAQELLKKNLQDSPESELDLRAIGLIDASFPTRASQERALEVLGKLDERRGVLNPEHRIILARLLSHKDWLKSSRLFRDVATHSKDPRYTAAYVDALLNHEELPEADVWLRRLEELSPGDFVTADLRVRWLARQRRYGEAFDRIASALSKEPSDPAARTAQRRAASARLEGIGNELTRDKHDEEARRFFTQAEAYLSGSDGRPTVDHLLFLVRRGRNSEALEEFDRWIEHASPADVDNACMAFAPVRTDDRQLLKRLEQSIARAAQRRPTAPILVSLAVIQERLEQYDEEEVSYRRALALDRTRVDALNNLAYILALRKKELTEARALVEAAIAQAGPRGALLDSRALVELAAGESGAALADAENAVREDPSAMHFFHQALVRRANGNAEAARDSFRKAIELGLAPAALHTLEVATFQDLKAQFGPPRR
jgi:cellulose synthase operon protein C